MLLSIIIVTFNSQEYIKKVIDSVAKNLGKLRAKTEIIVVDNASTDSTVEIVKKIRFKNLKLISSFENLGFSAANNLGVKKSSGKYILFLNPDVELIKVDFEALIKFLEKNSKRAALTIKLLLENKQLDKACHRGFPTPWRAFCYFTKLEELACLFPVGFLKKLFGGYHLCSKDLNRIHTIDSPSGAFFLVKRSVFEEVGGFDEDFFMYGEDLDLSYRIKKAGYLIFFYPKYKAIHYKYKSGLKSKKKTIQSKTRYHFWNAMRIFYEKHYKSKYPFFVNYLVLKVLNFKINSYATGN